MTSRDWQRLLTWQGNVDTESGPTASNAHRQPRLGFVEARSRRIWKITFRRFANEAASPLDMCIQHVMLCDEPKTCP
jgi:hypothetical protein